MAMVYDIMDCISYHPELQKINSEYYKRFLLDLNNGFYQVDNDILIVILAAQKRLNLDIETLIQKGMEFLKLNSAHRGTAHANFILTLGLDHIEVIIRKIIQNLFESNEHFKESNILIQFPKSSKAKNLEKYDKRKEEKDNKEILNPAHYKPSKEYYDSYYIKPPMQGYYIKKILQVNDPLLEIVSQPQYKPFKTIIRSSNILFKKKNEYSDCTYIVYTPFTKTGKDAKYPICCHYFIDESNNIPGQPPLPGENNFFGKIYLQKDETIGKGNINIWRNHKYLGISFKNESGKLVVTKVEEK